MRWFKVQCSIYSRPQVLHSISISLKNVICTTCRINVVWSCSGYYRRRHLHCWCEEKMCLFHELQQWYKLDCIRGFGDEYTTCTGSGCIIKASSMTTFHPFIYKWTWETYKYVTSNSILFLIVCFIIIILYQFTGTLSFWYVQIVHVLQGNYFLVFPGICTSPSCDLLL